MVQPWILFGPERSGRIGGNCSRSSKKKYRPRDPRNKSILHCTYLFGCVNRTDPGERPPLNKSEWRSRRQVAIALTRRLPELLTPRGVLARDTEVPMTGSRSTISCQQSRPWSRDRSISLAVTTECVRITTLARLLPTSSVTRGTCSRRDNRGKNAGVAAAY
jgi:hypothetical protein